MQPFAALRMRKPVVAGGGGSISFVGSAPVQNAINGGAITINYSSLKDAAGATPTVLQDDLVIFACGSSTGSDLDMQMSTAGYTEICDLYANAGSADANLGVFYKKMGASVDTTAAAVTNTGSSVSNIATMFVFRGVNTSTPLDVTVTTATGTGSSLPDPPSITPTTAGSWIVVVGEGAHPSSGAAYSAPGDLSSTTNHWRSDTAAPESNSCMIGVGLKTDWSSGAFNPAVWTGGSSGVNDGWAACTIALRPA